MEAYIAMTLTNVLIAKLCQKGILTNVEAIELIDTTFEGIGHVDTMMPTQQAEMEKARHYLHAIVNHYLRTG